MGGRAWLLCCYVHCVVAAYALFCVSLPAALFVYQLQHILCISPAGAARQLVDACGWGSQLEEALGVWHFVALGLQQHKDTCRCSEGHGCLIARSNKAGVRTTVGGSHA